MPARKHPHARTFCITKGAGVVRVCCSGVVLRAMFHPKQLLLFTGGDDAEVCVWDLVEKRCTAKLKVGARMCARAQCVSVPESSQ